MTEQRHFDLVTAVVKQSVAYVQALQEARLKRSISNYQHNTPDPSAEALELAVVELQNYAMTFAVESWQKAQETKYRLLDELAPSEAASRESW